MALLGDEILNSLKIPDFEPIPIFKDGISQTIVGAYWPFPKKDFTEKHHKVSVGDQESILLVEYSNPKATKAALLVHGLNGSHDSTYMKRLALRLLESGFEVYALNLRNSGIGLGLAKSTYHAGRSEDIVSAVQFIRNKKNFKQVAILGFSLGANIVLKTLGEGKLNHLPVVGVAVSPPVDLQACTENKLQSKKGLLFDKLFSYSTYKQFKAMQPYLDKKLGMTKWNLKVSLRDLDDLLTAPLNGFDSAEHYYQVNSAKRVYSEIQKPTLILTSYDDPVICPDFLLSAKHPDGVSVVVTKFGGHVAFLDRRTELRNWMDDLIVRYLSI